MPQLTHDAVWSPGYGDDWKTAKWKAVMQTAYKHGGGLYTIKRPNTILRCDICIKGKKKIATHASYVNLTLYCAIHAPQNSP